MDVSWLFYINLIASPVFDPQLPRKPSWQLAGCFVFVYFTEKGVNPLTLPKRGKIRSQNQGMHNKRKRSPIFFTSPKQANEDLLKHSTTIPEVYSRRNRKGVRMYYYATRCFFYAGSTHQCLPSDSLTATNPLTVGLCLSSLLTAHAVCRQPSKSSTCFFIPTVFFLSDEFPDAARKSSITFFSKSAVSCRGT